MNKKKWSELVSVFSDLTILVINIYVGRSSGKYQSSVRWQSDQLSA